MVFHILCGALFELFIELGPCCSDHNTYLRDFDMGSACSCFYCCAPCYGRDDAMKDGETSLIDDYHDQNKKHSSGWCVDDSATGWVFTPDGEL